jgi:hypothetical protein
MKKTQWMVAALLLGILAGCGGGPTTHPQGMIAGRVTDWRDGKPLKGVLVTVATRRQATTDEHGYYELGGLPASTYVVRFSMEGYVSRFALADLPDMVGEGKLPNEGTTNVVPLGNAYAEVNAVLAPGSASVKGKLYASQARPAAGAKVVMDLRTSGFDMVTEAVANAQGEFTIGGLPGAPLGLFFPMLVLPYDEDKDGLPDYEAFQKTVQVFAGTESREDINLAQANLRRLEVIFSDIDDNEHPASSPIKVAYNRPLDPERTQATLTTSGGSRVAVNVSYDQTFTNLTVKPSGGNFTVGAVYTLAIEGYAQNGGSHNFSRSFRAVGSVGSTLPRVTELVVTTQDPRDSTKEISEFNWNTRTLILRWNAVNGASGYRVFAKDTRNNQVFVAIQESVGTSPAPVHQVTLPSSFDVYTGDGAVTPLAFGTEVTVAVEPLDALGNHPDPATSTSARVLRDTVPPTVVSVTQSPADANNTTDQPMELTLTINFSEFIDPSGPKPTVTLPAGLTGTFQLDQGLMRGRVTVTVPPRTSAAGAIRVTGGQDTSGHALVQYDGQIRATQQLLVNTGFEGCSLAEWTAGNTNTASAPEAVSTTASAGACSVRLGNATFGTASQATQSGESFIQQEVAIPANTTTSFSVRYRGFTSSGGWDTWRCELRDTSDNLLRTLVSTTYIYSDSVWQTPTTVSPGTTYAGRTVRIRCYVTQNGSQASGVHLDELSLVATPL